MLAVDAVEKEALGALDEEGLAVQQERLDREGSNSPTPRPIEPCWRVCATKKPNI